jgi:hypothetical protein
MRDDEFPSYNRNEYVTTRYENGGRTTHHPIESTVAP